MTEFLHHPPHSKYSTSTPIFPISISQPQARERNASGMGDCIHLPSPGIPGEGREGVGSNNTQYPSYSYSYSCSFVWIPLKPLEPSHHSSLFSQISNLKSQI